MLSRPSTQKIFLLNFVTLGLYYFYWCAHSKRDIEASARQSLMPTTWLLAVPLFNYWWAWQYSEALEHVSYKRIKGSDIFLFYLLGTLSPTIIGTYVPSFSSTNNGPITSHEIFSALAVFGITLWLGWIIGMAMFCAVAQNKINKLSPTPAH
jgi:hypothetical protein